MVLSWLSLREVSLDTTVGRRRVRGACPWTGIKYQLDCGSNATMPSLEMQDSSVVGLQVVYLAGHNYFKQLVSQDVKPTFKSFGYKKSCEACPTSVEFLQLLFGSPQLVFPFHEKFRK